MSSSIKIIVPAPDAPRDLVTSRGARLFVGGIEVENVEALSFCTSLKADDIARTTLIVTLYGVVELEFESSDVGGSALG